MKSCGARFGTKSLLFAFEGGNEIGSKHLRFSVLCGAQILLAVRVLQNQVPQLGKHMCGEPVLSSVLIVTCTA